MYILPAIFYVHGVGGSANIWANQIEYFAQLGHEVIAPDLLGHGFSSAPDKPKSYTFPKILRDILTIFDHFVARSREVVVVGHSYGCSMAAALARSRPESVKLLVMCASGGPTPLAPPKQLSKVPKSLIGCLKPFLKCRFGTSQKYVSRGKATKIQEAFDVPAYVLHHVLMGQLWPEGEFYNLFNFVQLFNANPFSICVQLFNSVHLFSFVQLFNADPFSILFNYSILINFSILSDFQFCLIFNFQFCSTFQFDQFSIFNLVDFVPFSILSHLILSNFQL
mgnify:CR=1 FL=1